MQNRINSRKILIAFIILFIIFLLFVFFQNQEIRKSLGLIDNDNEIKAEIDEKINMQIENGGENEDISFISIIFQSNDENNKITKIEYPRINEEDTNIIINTAKQKVAIDYPVTEELSNSDKFIITLENGDAIEQTVLFKIKYDVNGGNGENFEEIAIKGIENKLTGVQPQRSEYVFKGWSTDKEAETSEFVDDNVISDIYDDEITLYAIWKKETIKISFNSNSGEGQMEDIEVEKGIEINLPENQFSREYYYFVKWNTNSDGTGEDYIDKIIATENITLYAQWERNAVIGRVYTTSTGKYDASTSVLGTNVLYTTVRNGVGKNIDDCLTIIYDQANYCWVLTPIKENIYYSTSSNIDDESEWTKLTRLSWGYQQYINYYIAIME